MVPVAAGLPVRAARLFAVPVRLVPVRLVPARLAPVPLAFASDPRRAIELAGESSWTTHGAESAADACRYAAGLLLGALAGVAKTELLDGVYEPFPGAWTEQPLGPEIERVTAGSFREREPPEIRGSGYVVECLEAALWALDRSSSFREGCLLAVNLGDDADTTGAVFGQLAGALYCAHGIPSHSAGRTLGSAGGWGKRGRMNGRGKATGANGAPSWPRGGC